MAEALQWVSRITTVALMMLLPILGGRKLDEMRGTGYAGRLAVAAVGRRFNSRAISSEVGGQEVACRTFGPPDGQADERFGPDRNRRVAEG
jgi:hypothetical protein